MQLTSVELILVDWCCKNNEFELLFYLFTLLNIGVPNKYLYLLQNKKNIFNSLNSFFTPSIPRFSGYDHHFYNQLLDAFQKSKFQQLIEWNNLYGYRYK